MQVLNMFNLFTDHGLTLSVTQSDYVPQRFSKPPPCASLHKVRDHESETVPFSLFNLLLTVESVKDGLIFTVVTILPCVCRTPRLGQNVLFLQG